VTRSVFNFAYQEMLRRLTSARKANGLTQIQLAKRLKRPQSYVSKFENGDRRIDVIEFIEICHALNADPLATVEVVQSFVE
jgi:transcriptional regulator with XRE-family HTH domain